MSCISYAIDGQCCMCYSDVDGDYVGAKTDALTEVETRSGTHYLCDECFEKHKKKYEDGEMDIFNVVDE